MFRIAPTPSGYLHKGNLFSFWLTRDWALRLNKPLFLRIDDLDQARERKEYVSFIFEALRFYGIEWQAGPQNIQEQPSYSQLGRIPLYKEAIEKLKRQAFIFPCKCSRKKIREAGLQSGCASNCAKDTEGEKRRGVCWRFKTRDEKVSYTDLNGIIKELSYPKEMREFIVERKAGLAAYQIASLVDDIHFGISHIVRGNGLRPSTWAQWQLAEALSLSSFHQIQFLHHPLLMEDQQKLSKSNRSPALKLQEQERKLLWGEYTEWIKRERLLD